MSIIVMVFGKKACREYLLDGKKQYHRLLLDADFFGLVEDLSLNLRCQNDRWKPESEREDIRIVEAEEIAVDSGVGQIGWQQNEACDLGRCMIWTSYGEKLEVSFKERRSGLKAMRKYRLQDGLIIGRGETCQLVLQGNKRISRKHLLFAGGGNQWRVHNFSQNGYYLNGTYTEQEQVLTFGDCITLMEHKLVFLGEWLAVDSPALTFVSVEAEETGTTRNNPLVYDPACADLAGLNMERLDSKKQLPGDRKRVEIERKESLSEEGDGRIKIHRAPRNVERIDTEPISIDRPPNLEPVRRDTMLMAAGPMLSMAIPMLAGSLFMLYAMQREQKTLGLSAYTGLVMTGLTVLFTLAWSVIGTRLKERQDKKRVAVTERSYRKYLSAKNESIKSRYDMTRHILLCRYPSAGDCIEYRETSALLWARNAYHEDFLWHRLGIGEVAFPTKISVPKEEYRDADTELWQHMTAICEHYRMMSDLPILLHLGEYRQIGLIGESRREVWELVRILAMQIAAGNCYSEVKAAVFCNTDWKDEREQLDFFRWMPHLWDQGFKRRYLAGNREEARELAYELSQIFKNRANYKKGGSHSTDGKDTAFMPHYVLFIFEPDYLEGEMLGRYLFEETVPLGLTVFWCVDEREKLPNSCRFIVEKTENFHGMYDVTGGYQEKVKIEFDQLDQTSCCHFARRLARMYVTESLTGGDLPSKVTFFSLFEVNKVEELKIEERWERNRTSESMRAAIGLKTGGRRIYLDLHEKYHGPHGLIAGTTGSGKSEMLQSYILSMALNYSPVEVNFFLIDYKGGGMAGLFGGLPHICGSISNLSGGLISRALTSIKSENLRRQRLFSVHGVNHIESYSKLFYEGRVDSPLPHLIIIIDEFAELKKEQPDFMKELISVAQVGRSLGVHLILATQKPAGTVSDNIWSNSRFRICLKVQDRQDSMEMIRRDDAARITQTGRGYLQVGNDELFELFQSGWSGAPEEDTQIESVRIIGNNGQPLSLPVAKGKAAAAGTGMPQRGEAAGRAVFSARKQRSQLEAIVEHICAVSERRQKYPVRSLWMDPLPELLCLEDLLSTDLEQGKEAEQTGMPAIVVGMLDDPEEQQRELFKFNPADLGHSLLCGSTLSGKSTFLQTFVYALMKQYTPEQIHLYIYDFGGGALQCFQGLPHLAGMAKSGEDEKVRRIMDRLLGELDKRQELLQGGNVHQYRDSEGKKLPMIFLFIDSYGDFQEKTGEIYGKAIWRILKEGENCGVILFLSGRGLTAVEIPSSMANYFRTKICLSMKEIFNYMEVLGCLSLSVTPEPGIAGRGITFFGKRILEFQTALCLNERNDFLRKERIAEEVKKLADGYAGPLPEKIRCIPENLTWNRYWKEVKDLVSGKGRPADGEAVEGKIRDGCVFLGYDDQTANLYAVDLSSAYCLCLTGSDSGSVHMMKVFMESCRREGMRQLILLDLGNSLPECKAVEYIKAYGQTEEEVLEIFQMLSDIFSERKADEGRSKEWEYYIVFITGFSNLMNMAYHGDLGMDGFLENIWEKGRGKRILFLAQIDNTQIDALQMYRAFRLFCNGSMGFAAGGALMDLRLFSCGALPYEEQLRVLEKRECYVFSEEKEITKIIVPEVVEV